MNAFHPVTIEHRFLITRAEAEERVGALLLESLDERARGPRVDHVELARIASGIADASAAIAFIEGWGA